MPATSISYYSDGIGGRGAIRFDGVDDKYLIAECYDPRCLCCCSNQRGAGTFRSPIMSRATFKGYNFYASEDNIWELWSGKGSTPWDYGESSLETISDVPKLLEHSIDTSSSPNVNKLINGSSVATAASFSPNPDQPLFVGEYGAAYWNGDIGEVIIFNANLTTTQKEGLRQVLANKWGLGMAAPSSSAFSSDTMTGGAGADRFVYTIDSFSPPANRDIITDFNPAQGDILDFTDLEMDFAIQGALGLQSSGHSEAAWKVDGSNILVQLDYDGDGTAELEVQLNGSVSIADLSVDNILLNGNDMNDTGADTLVGTSANDILVGGYGGDTIDGQRHHLS